MKKTTLTIGLFSLVMVLTSFTTPETVTTKSSNEVVNLGIDGGMAGGGRKVDVASTQARDIDGGMAGGGRKVDVASTQARDIDGGMAGGGRKVD